MKKMKTISVDSTPWMRRVSGGGYLRSLMEKRFIDDVVTPAFEHNELQYNLHQIVKDLDDIESGLDRFCCEVEKIFNKINESDCYGIVREAESQLLTHLMFIREMISLVFFAEYPFGRNDYGTRCDLFRSDVTVIDNFGMFENKGCTTISLRNLKIDGWFSVGLSLDLEVHDEFPLTPRTHRNADLMRKTFSPIDKFIDLIVQTMLSKDPYGMTPPPLVEFTHCETEWCKDKDDNLFLSVSNGLAPKSHSGAPIILSLDAVKYLYDVFLGVDDEPDYEWIENFYPNTYFVPGDGTFQNIPGVSLKIHSPKDDRPYVLSLVRKSTDTGYTPILERNHQLFVYHLDDIIPDTLLEMRGESL